MDYLNHFGLDNEPFANSPVNRFYFHSTQHDQALKRLTYVASSMKGLAVCIGNVGHGKTTLARRLLDHLLDNDYEAAMLIIVHEGVGATWLLRRIAMQLGVADPGEEKLTIINRLYQRLVEIHEAGRKAVVIIDEAQMLNTKEIMEEFRGLLNIEVPGHKLISFIFCGLPELEQHLMLDPPLAQRVALKYRIGPFDEANTYAYINFRMDQAGAQREVFTSEAITAIHQASHGIPRVINTICDNALLEAFLCNQSIVTAEIVQQVAENLGTLPVEPTPVSAIIEKPTAVEEPSYFYQPVPSPNAFNVTADVNIMNTTEVINDMPRYDAPGATAEKTFAEIEDTASTIAAVDNGTAQAQDEEEDFTAVAAAEYPDANVNEAHNIEAEIVDEAVDQVTDEDDFSTVATDDDLAVDSTEDDFSEVATADEFAENNEEDDEVVTYVRPTREPTDSSLSDSLAFYAEVTAQVAQTQTELDKNNAIDPAISSGRVDSITEEVAVDDIDYSCVDTGSVPCDEPIANEAINVEADYADDIESDYAYGDDNTDDNIDDNITHESIDDVYADDYSTIDSDELTASNAATAASDDDIYQEASFDVSLNTVEISNTSIPDDFDVTAVADDSFESADDPVTMGPDNEAAISENEVASSPDLNAAIEQQYQEEVMFAPLPATPAPVEADVLNINKPLTRRSTIDLAALDDLLAGLKKRH